MGRRAGVIAAGGEGTGKGVGGVMSGEQWLHGKQPWWSRQANASRVSDEGDGARWGGWPMRHYWRQSILAQLLSAYLLFVVIVVSSGVGFNLFIQQRLQHDVQTADQALAQEIALETSLQLTDAETSLVKLGQLVAQTSSSAQITTLFRAYQAAQAQVEYVYWLDPVGALKVVWPKTSDLGVGSEFSPPDVVQRAIASADPVYEVGIAVTATFSAGVIIAEPVRTLDGGLIGIVAINVSLFELSEPLTTVVNAQLHDGRHLNISIIDSEGELIATPDHKRVLQTVLDELPGADQALHGRVDSRLGTGPDGQNWLFSSVPVPYTGWAVIVQRPASEALSVITQFRIWLWITVALFAIGGLLFWLMLINRVIGPLHTLASQHQTLPTSEQAIHAHATTLAQRNDEMGGLARSLVRLERDGLEKLGELRTLLETSNAVVSSLDPYAVVGTIIREARRLVDAQAAAALAPDDEGRLRVLVSDGHSEKFDRALSLSAEDNSSSAMQAWRNGKPTQRILGPDIPSLAYNEGFRSVLAIPIISRHAGGLVLLTHRTDPVAFTETEVDLLLTFANYAALAWEHAVLYERSDERLREVAQENQQLYQRAAQEKQTLEAIMGSMTDGLALTGPDGAILYANHGASLIAGITSATLERQPISQLYDALCAQAAEPADAERLRAWSAAWSAAAGETSGDAAPDTVIQIRGYDRRRAIHLRLFDVGDESGRVIGRGLLLRDVTRERELDDFKSALLAAVGHELRTPLAAIKGHASTLLQEDVTWPQADQQHFLQTISNEADRLAQLVSNLLDLSRQEAGLLLLKRSPTSVQEMVAQVVARLQRPGVRLSYAIPDDLPLVEVDSARLDVVLHNLLTNALTYGENEAQVTAFRRDAMVVVAVTDNGPGVAPDELPHLFERFYRTQHAREHHSGGAGLGLAICKAFVEAHGGAIWAEASAQGTTIAFTLPLVAPAPLRLPESSGTHEAPAAQPTTPHATASATTDQTAAKEPEPTTA